MKYIPFHLTQIRGRLGKLYVIKKSKYGYLIKTKYPNMKHIKATIKQRERREVFKQAVAYAKWLYADADRKKAFLKTIRKRKHRAFQTAMKLYLHASLQRQLNLKLAMLKSCLLQRKLQREARIAKNNYFHQGPWKQLWPNNQQSLYYSVLLVPVHLFHSFVPLCGSKISLCTLRLCEKPSYALPFNNAQ